MKYINAKDVLPPELLEKVQKYCSGRLLYIPSDQINSNWGEKSGYREKLKKRNLMINNKYSNGSTVSELAEEYFLSIDSVKKIIYSKNKDHVLLYESSLSSALAYADASLIKEWVESNIQFTLKKENSFKDLNAIYFGVVKLPLRFVELSERVSDETYEVNDSPILVEYSKKKFNLLSETTKFNNLKKQKINAYQAIIVISDSNDYKHFMINYGRHLIFIDQ